MDKITHKKRGLLGYTVFFLLLLAGALLLNAPLSFINRWLPEGTQLINTNGNIHKGRWQDIHINGKRYPLTCDYHRVSLGLTTASYQLNCQTPLTLETTLVIGFNGDITLTDTLINGEIQNTRDWLQLLGVPAQISGEIGIHLEKVTLINMTLTDLSASGGVQRIALFNTPVVQAVRINTLSPKLTDTQPIKLEIRTPKGSDNSETVRVYLTSEIDGKNYHTHGEISGTLLEKYAMILRYFGQQTGQNTFAVQMQGRLLP